MILACVMVTLLAGVATAGLLRVPKVYNALITSNEKLVPSEAIQVSAPLLHPVGLAPAVPAVVVASPYIAVDDSLSKPNKTETVTSPENESDKSPEGEKNATSSITPVITPFSLPVAYYNAITYYHNLWPYSYSSVSPATFLFTAPFSYPGLFNLYGGQVKKPESDPASSKDSTDNIPSGTKDDAEKESVSTEAS
jgi:hypothetical protein